MLVLKIQNRDCNGCTKCCEGWLWGEAYGTQFSVGKPCYFLRANQCSIYPVRPVNPCQTFLCGWKSDPRIPEWLWPKSSGLIVLPKVLQPAMLEYVLIVRAGGEITPRILEWAEVYGPRHRPVILSTPDGIKIYSNQAFRDAYELTQKTTSL